MRIILSSCIFLCISFYSFSQEYFPVKMDGKWGLIDANGEIFLKATYDAVGSFEGNYATIQKKNKVGVINRAGEEVLKPIYQDVSILDSTLFTIFEDQRWKVINPQEEIILDKPYEEVRVIGGRYLAYVFEGKWGLIHTDGRSISNPKYDRVRLYQEQYFITYEKGKMGLLADDGVEILRPAFDKIVIPASNIYFFRKDRVWGAVNKNGEAILALEYQMFEPLSTGFLRLEDTLSRPYLFSIPLSKPIAGTEFEEYLPYNEDLAMCRKLGKIGLINTQGEVILNPEFDEVHLYGDQLYRVQKDRKWGVAQRGGALLIPINYDFIAPLRTQVAAVQIKDKFGVVNIKGNEVVRCIYDRMNIEDNVAYAYTGETLKMISFNEEGELAEEDSFNKFGTIKVGFNTKKVRGAVSNTMRPMFVMENFEWFYHSNTQKWGLRNIQTGKIQISPTYDHIEVKPDLGFTIVGKESIVKQWFDRTSFKYFYVYGIVDNKSGRATTEVNMLDIRINDFVQDSLPVARVVFSSGLHGLINKRGVIIQENMGYIGDFSSGRARCSVKGRLSVKMMNGEEHLGSLNDFMSTMRSQNYLESITLVDQRLFEKGKMFVDKGEWGYLDTLGKLVIPGQYDFAKDFRSGVGIVKQNDKWGTIGYNGEVLLENEFDEIHFLKASNNQILRVYVNEEKYGVIDSTGKVVVEVMYEEVGEFNEGRIPVKRNGKWGFMDQKGNEIIPCIYEKVLNFSEGLAGVRLKRRWGFVDRNGEIILDHNYRRVGQFSNGLAWAAITSKSGYINKKGEEVIAFEFTQCFDFEGDIARVRDGSDYGIINKEGQFVLRPKYPKIEAFNRYGLAITYYGGGDYGVINRQGEKICNEKFERIFPYSDGMAMVRSKGKFGFINEKGVLAIPLQFSRLEAFSEDRAAFMEKGRWGFIDKNGKKIIPAEYSKCLSFNEGKAVVYKGYRNSGLIDETGKYFIEPSVDRILDFTEGRGLVRTKEHRHYFITEENRLYKGYFNGGSAFKDGIASVKIGSKWGIINLNGIEIIPPKYAKIEAFNRGYAKVQIRRFSGVADLNGKVIIEPEYEYISYLGGNLFRVERGDRLGYIDSFGKWVWEMRK